jgi:hypothetical protein
MLTSPSDYSDFHKWTALMAYLLGYAFFGFLLAMASPTLPALAVTGMTGGVICLAWAGALAAGNRPQQSFSLSALGAVLVTGAVAWAATISGAKAFAGAVLSVVFWGLTWALAESEPIAGPVALAFGWVAIVSWAANAAVFLAGVIFMFVSSGCTAMGERLGEQMESSEIFVMLTLLAVAGLGLGWLGRGIF